MLASFCRRGGYRMFQSRVAGQTCHVPSIHSVDVFSCKDMIGIATVT